MRRLVAAVVLVALVLVVAAPAAQAGTATDVALGLASFAVFNQLFAPVLRTGYAPGPAYHPTVIYRTVVTPPPVSYGPAPVVVAPPPPPPAQPTVVQYPHGRYELRVNGYQYVWVWIPAMPPPPPPPPPPALAPPPAS